MLGVVTLFWGVSFPVIKAITSINRGFAPGGGTWYLASMALAPRFALAAVLMAALELRRGGLPRRGEVLRGAAIGLLASAGMLLQTDGLQYADASVSAFLTQFSAILIPLWLALVGRRAPGPRVWAGCILVLAGAGVLGHVSLHAFRLGRGEWETLLASVFFMWQILLVGRGDACGLRAGSVTLAMFTTQGVVYSALAAATAPGLPSLLRPWTSVPWVGLTVILAVVCTLGAFGVMNAWQPKISATEAGLIYCLEPLSASVLALFVPAWISAWAGIHYPNESLTMSLFIGGGLITLANLLVLVRPIE